MLQGCEGRPPVLGPVSHVGAVMRAQAHQPKFSAPTCVTTKGRSPTVGRGVSIAPRCPALRTPTPRLGLVFVWRPRARRCATPGQPRPNLKTHDGPVTARPSAREPQPARAPRPNSSPYRLLGQDFPNIDTHPPRPCNNTGTITKTQVELQWFCKTRCQATAVPETQGLAAPAPPPR